MKETTIIVTQTYALCPHCGKTGSTIDHAELEWFPPWCCNHCGEWYQARKIQGCFEVRKAIPRMGIWDCVRHPDYWLILKCGDLVVIIKSSHSPPKGTETKEEWLGHLEYYYEEHTCPTNFIRGVDEIAYEGVIDNQRMFQSGAGNPGSGR